MGATSQSPTPQSRIPAPATTHAPSADVLLLASLHTDS